MPNINLKTFLMESWLCSILPDCQIIDFWLIWSQITSSSNHRVLIICCQTTGSSNLRMLLCVKPAVHKIWVLIVRCQTRGGTTRWCHVQKFTCCSTGSRHQYIVIWLGWHYQIFSVLLRRLLRSWMINGESLSVNYW